MKKFLCGILVLALAVCSLAVFAGCNNNKLSEESQTGLVYSVEKDDNNEKYAVLKKYNLTDEQAEKVASGNYADAMVELSINEYEYDGVKLPVKEIAEDAFSNQVIIKKVTFGDKVEKIGKGCFAGCSNLQEIVTPFIGEESDSVNSAKVMGYWFGTAEAENCSSVVMLYNGGDSDSMTVYIPSSLKKITVTGNVISDYAFYGSALEEINLTGSVKKIGAYTFAGMTALAEFKLPASVEEIGKNAFANATSLYNVDFSSATALKTIWQEAFIGCTTLGFNGKTITLPASVEKIYYSAFKSCTALKSIDLSATKITEIPTACFYGCEKLATLKCKNNVSFGNDAVPTATTVDKI